MTQILLISKISIFLCFSAFGQSLISGGDFETPISIPNNYGQITLQPNCIAAYGTPDLFHKDAQSFGVLNPLGIQEPTFGKGYAGFLASDYERIAFRLNDQLLKNEKYLLSFYISTAEKSQCLRTPIVGRLAFKSEEYMNKNTPHIRFDSLEPLYNMSNWVHISDTLVAQGGEEYVIIGFENLDRFNHSCLTYYYLDEVTLTGLITPSKSTEIKVVKDSISIFYDSKVVSMSKEDSIQINQWISTIPFKTINKIYVFGSADSQGNYEFNVDLSLKRAEIVTNYIQIILDKQIEIEFTSHASINKDVESNDRRVDIVIEYEIEIESESQKTLGN